MRLNQKDPRDHEGQRETDGKGDALARCRIERHVALEPADGGLDHIHTDATPGDFTQFWRCTEAGFEDQGRELLVRPLRGFCFRHEAAAYSSGSEPLRVGARTT